MRIMILHSKGSTKNERKLTRGKKERIEKGIESLKDEKSSAKTKTEKEAIQKKIDHLKRQLKPSEPHGRSSKRH